MIQTSSLDLEKFIPLCKNSRTFYFFPESSDNNSLESKSDKLFLTKDHLQKFTHMYNFVECLRSISITSGQITFENINNWVVHHP